MSGRWPPESKAKNASSLRDEHHGAMEDTDMAVGEEDVAELCKMEIWTVKNMIRPDTLRIGTSFNEMMAAVKRRSSQRHQDVNTAIERCFTAFSGRGKNSLSIRQFARRLSVLSMEWSGNFSKEEYLALAQDLSEEDIPGIVTLESFKCAAKNGSVSLSPKHPPRWRKKGDESSTRSTAARDAAQEGSRHGYHVEEFDDEVGGKRGSGLQTTTEDTLATTLTQAASKARTKGQDVWKLLDACMQAVLKEAQQDEDADTPTSEDVAAQTNLSPEVVHRFLSKLDVRVVSSPPSPSPARPPSIVPGETQRQSGGTTGEQQQKPDEQAANSGSPRHRAHGRSPSFEQREGAGETAAVSSFLSVRNAFEARSRGSGGGSPVRSASPTPSSSSPQFSSARNAFEGNKKGIQKGQSVKSEAPAPSSPPSQEASSVCDRYLRALSRDTASVRCRVLFYNQELARTLQEAESLVSRASGTNVSSGGNCEQRSRLSPDVDGSAASRRGIGGGGGIGGCGGGEGVVAEVGGGMAAVSGGGGSAGMSSTGPIVAFSRISPVGRADPSHPRMELATRPGSTPPAPSPPARSGQAQDPDWGSGSPRQEGGSGSGSGSGERRTPAGMGRRKSSSDETKVAVSDRVAKLLLAALDETKANGPSASVAPPAAAERKKIAVTPKTACFDPPSVRNGLTGLTPGHVDKVLLRVEASTPGAVSSWKSPVGRTRPRTGGTEVLTPLTLGRGLAGEAQDRRRRQLENYQEGSIGWFDAQGSARGMLQETGAQGEARGGPGARRKKGGGGARRKRSIFKIKLPPRMPRTPSKKGGDNDAIQAAPAAAQRKSSWGVEHVEWASSVDDDDEEEDASEDFTGNNPMYARPVEVVEEKNIQHRTLPAPPKRSFSFASRRTRVPSSNETGGPSSSSSQPRSVRQDSSLSATYAHGTRRPVRGFQKLDADVYDGFLHCAKKGDKPRKGIRRMGILG